MDMYLHILPPVSPVNQTCTGLRSALDSTHPISVVDHGNYHVIVYYVYSGVQHLMISMLFIL